MMGALGHCRGKVGHQTQVGARWGIGSIGAKVDTSRQGRGKDQSHDSFAFRVGELVCAVAGLFRGAVHPCRPLCAPHAEADCIAPNATTPGDSADAIAATAFILVSLSLAFS